MKFLVVLLLVIALGAIVLLIARTKRADAATEAANRAAKDALDTAQRQVEASNKLLKEALARVEGRQA